jgi:hypothetical protein
MEPDPPGTTGPAAIYTAEELAGLGYTPEQIAWYMQTYAYMQSYQYG